MASLPELPGPIELPQVFIRREEKVEESEAERMMSSLYCEKRGNDVYVMEEDDNLCPLDVVIDPNSRRRNVVTATTTATPSTISMDVVTSPTITSYDNALNNINDMMSMGIDGTYLIMTEEACPPTTMTYPDGRGGGNEGLKSSSLSAMTRAQQLLQRHHRSYDGSCQLQLQRHISVDSSGFDKDALQMALSLSMQQQQSSQPPIHNIGGEVNVVSSSSSEVTLGSKMEVVEGGGFSSSSK